MVLFTAQAHIKDDDTKLPIEGATIELENRDTGMIEFSGVSNADGDWFVYIDDDVGYYINITKAGYEYHTGRFQATHISPLDEVALEPIGLLPLVANASADKTSGNVPLTVNFTGSASGGIPPYSYSWNFGDGGISTSQNPSHTYTVASTYNVTLIVTDSAMVDSADTIGIWAGVTKMEIPWWIILFPIGYLFYKRIKK